MDARATVDDYSWDELAELSLQLASLGGDKALDLARSMNLVGADGRLDGSQSKRILLADGISTSATIIGIGCDALVGRDAGSAGLTFMFCDAVALHAMNNDAGFAAYAEEEPLNTYGGWCASEARSWLNSTFADWLPFELEAVIQTVEKTSIAAFSISAFDDESPTAAIGRLSEVSCDRIWLPAATEVADAAKELEAVADYPALAQVLAAEGPLYPRFADSADIKDARVRTLAGEGAGSGIAVRWWLRSTVGGSFSEILEHGTAACYGESPSGSPQGMVPCFCI